MSLLLFAVACGPTTADIEIRDGRIAALEADKKAQTEALEECNSEREKLNQLVAAVSADAKRSKTQSQSQIDSMRKALDAAAERERQAKVRLATFRSMLGQLKSMIDSGKLRVRIVRNRMVVELPEAVLFPSGQASLRKEGQKVLAELGPVLTGLQDREFQVGGHTDNVPIRTSRFPSNWELSSARAVNVTKLLIDSGLDASRVSAAGYADTQPVADNETKEGRAQNRRIEIALLPNLKELPDLSSLEGLK